MKKFLVVTIALMMILTAVVSLAEGAPSPSINATVIQKAVTNNPNIKVVRVEDTAATKEINDVLMAADDENVLSVIPEDITLMLPEDYSKVNEISTWEIEGDISAIEEISVLFTFTVPYETSAKVYLLIGIPAAEGTVEWILVEGQASEAGDVFVIFNKDILTKLDNSEFVVVVVNKK